LGFCAGFNFFIFEASLVPFEVTAFNVVLRFWTDKIPLPAVICFVLLSYAWVIGLSRMHVYVLTTLL